MVEIAEIMLKQLKICEKNGESLKRRRICSNNFLSCAWYIGQSTDTLVRTVDDEKHARKVSAKISSLTTGMVSVTQSSYANSLDILLSSILVLQAGDRFYYENGGQPTSFTPAQLQEIRKTSLARVLCDTSDGMAVMQPLAFLHANFT